MIKLKKVTAKNFLSIGNIPQEVTLDDGDLVLVLGENLDLGGTDHRNGTGKSTCVNAITFALYGQSLSNIRKENLINKTNAKQMLVTLDFESDGTQYRIERGRKPNILKLYVNDVELKTQETDDSQGDSRETQKHIEQILGMSHTMFKHLVALNTYTEPFLSMRTSDQREVIEQLLGITVLSEKAENLKTLMKATKDEIQAESYRIDGIKLANDNIQRSINSLIAKSDDWERKKASDLDEIGEAIINLSMLDIDAEIKAHNDMKYWSELNAAIKDLERRRTSAISTVNRSEKLLEKLKSEIFHLESHKCPSCDQDLHDQKHSEMIAKAEHDLAEAITYHDGVATELAAIEQALIEIGPLPVKPSTFYRTEQEAQSHKSNLANLERDLEIRIGDTNPYTEQVEELQQSALQEISWDTINELTKLKEHQDFLYKLLTNKDSFIRKKIIDQNLNHLNRRLAYYIDKLGLPHRVVFQNDLSVDITQYGQSLDFDNLSRGERNRLILSLSFAFRDVWESLYQHINLLFVDELMDSGMDASGVESALQVLKQMSRERNKNIFLISHRDELVSRVNNILKVIKESGFTRYEATSN